jgi:outer membrane lipoprotein carrier protein
LNFLLALAVLSQAPAFAVDAAPPAASTASAAAQTATTSTQPITAAAVLTKIRDLDASLHSLSASFQQTLTTGAGLKQEQSGKLFYDKPDHIRLEFEQPRRQITVSDRKLLWVYQPDDKQVIRADWDDWKKSQSELSGLLDFGQYGSLLDRHDVSVEPYRAEGSTIPVAGAWRLTLKPKSSTSYTIDLIVEAPDYFPKRTELAMERMKIVSELKDVELNPKLEAKIFEFKPPSGVPVIELSNP